ncbi:FAD:protein FMN transferase [Arundinibacter roseus]|uniref:FAD:protein FMN transferase n=1 Tax=Arundinibacter roseus TaxID=2070510 RepID=A0A4R4K9H6_9BACT|nr:FAD:protein FMN transferase [Arundinibacter roseus]TDB64173.1 FAD:protein FMN transferase [Arundinibacter roseus]
MSRFSGLIFLVFFSGIGCQAPRQGYTQLEGNAQGTTFRIVYDDAESRDFSTAVDSIFHVMDRSMSLWDSTSVISSFNANRPAARADAHFTQVFSKATEVSEQTDGYFDCTVGPLVKAWGFSFKKGLPEPDSQQVMQLQQQIGYKKMTLTEGKLVKESPEMQVDFNAIAQGYTVDVLADFLKAKGVQNYLVEVGGEVRAEGKNERGEVWRVGIDKPIESNEQNRSLQGVVALNGRALATSGSYRKFVERDGHKYSHAIDPHTGFPITHSLLSISVIANDCMTADAYATAFLVMGLEKAIPLAKQNGLELYGILTEKDGTFRIYQSEGFGAEEVK